MPMYLLVETYQQSSNYTTKSQPFKSVRNKHELRVKVAEYLGEPESDIETYYVPFYNVEDKEDATDPRFVVLLSTKKNLSKLRNDTVLQTDATYRLNWHGFPVWVVGMYISDIALIK